MPRISDSIVKSVRPAAKDQTLFDSELPGFALKVTPHGRKVFLFQYWSPIERTKRRRFTIGTLGDSLAKPDGTTTVITATSARAEAERLRGIVRAKRDPFLERKDEAKAEGAARIAERARTASLRPVRAVADAMLDELTQRRKSPRTLKEYRRLLEKHLLSVRVSSDLVLGDQAIAAVGRAEALAVRRQRYTVEGRKAGKKVIVPRALEAQPILANRVQQLARALINYAEEVGARPHGEVNPFGGKRWHDEKETREALTSDEIAALHSSLAVEDDGTRGGSVDAIRFLLYTGMRKGEALSLRWDAIDENRGIVTLAHHKTSRKTGASVRPLSREALAVLAQIPRRGVHVFVMPGESGSLPHRVEIKRTWLRVRQRAGITKPLHSLRHTMASVALTEGVPLAAVGAILGHADQATTARYAKFEDDRAKAFADVAGAAISRAAQPATVISIASKGKSSTARSRA